jgi:hypothetical protein
VSVHGDVDLSEYGDGMGPEYEWLLSDHPLAVAERERRAAAFYTAEAQHEVGLSGPDEEQFAGHLPAMDDFVGGMATPIDPSADPDLERHRLEPAPDEVTVARSRADYEAYRRAHGEPDYAYPARYVGEEAAAFPPPRS